MTSFFYCDMKKYRKYNHIRVIHVQINSHSYHHNVQTRRFTCNLTMLIWCWKIITIKRYFSCRLIVENENLANVLFVSSSTNVVAGRV